MFDTYDKIFNWFLNNGALQELKNVQCRLQYDASTFKHVNVFIDGIENYKKNGGGVYNSAPDLKFQEVGSIKFDIIHNEYIERKFEGGKEIIDKVL